MKRPSLKTILIQVCFMITVCVCVFECIGGYNNDNDDDDNNNDNSLEMCNSTFLYLQPPH